MYPDKTMQFDSENTPAIRGGTVSVENIVRRYASLTAIDHVNLSVGQGEFVALLGPSGSGKTTLLMTIAGFDVPDEGAVRINGVDISRMPPHKRDIGMVFQKYALFPHLSVLDNVAFPLRMRSISAPVRRMRALEALKMVGLEGLEQRLPGQLSGGQQQRVALARAIVFRPPVLLMDEPLGALDKKLRERMQIEIKHLQEYLGATVIYVTHDQEEALTMADKIAVMNHGRVEQIGAPTDLYERPVNPFVASFIGETNLLDGELLEARESGWSIRLSNGHVVAGTPSASVARNPKAGSKVRLAVRPERVELASASASRSDLSGTVTETIYAGPTTIYLIRCENLPEISVRVPVQNDNLRSSRGDVVAMTWSPGNALIF